MASPPSLVSMNQPTITKEKNMSTTERKFSDLIEWDGNPRPPASFEKRSEMRASLAHTGQIMPLIAREVGDKTEVVAGRNRLRSIGELISDGKWDKDKPILVHVRVMDDAEALEVATSENINIPMHPMHQYEAFSRMVEMGKDPVEIANTYGVSERIVERRLSYAKLDERARELVKNNDRDLDWASAMTIASPKEQDSIIEEIMADPRRYRTAHEIRSRLQDDLVPLSYALFDKGAAAADAVRRDLFDENDESYMHRKDFMPLQDKALADAVEKAKAEGWSDVQVMSDKEFDIYKYVDGVTDKDKAVVIFVRHASGEIVTYEGMALRYEERINEIAADDAEAAEGIFGDSPEIDDDLQARVIEESDEDLYVEGSKTTKHLDKERAAIVQKMLLEDPKAALAVTIAGLVGSSAARPLEGKTFGDLTDLDNDSIARRAIEDKAKLSYDIMSNAGIDPLGSYPDLLSGLYSLSESDLMIIYQSELARRITTDIKRGADLYETLLEVTGTTVADHWTMDRTFLSTLSVKSIRGLAGDVLPPRLAGKLGKGKSDAIETMAEIAVDAREEGGRLGGDERRAFTSWAPKGLGGEQYETIAGALNENGDFLCEGDGDEDGAAIFSDDDEVSKAA